MISEKIKTSLEQLHRESFIWSLRCCFEDKVAAEEVLQRTYLKILEGKARYLEQSSFKTWLFSVIRYTAIDYFRKIKRSQLIKDLPTEDNSKKMFEDGESQLVFKQILNELSPQQKHILHLVFYQNLSIQGAAEVMEIQLGTARTHYERGKRQLKKKLEAAGFSNKGRFIRS